MRPFILLIGLVTALVLCQEARAARNEEVVRYPSLITVEDFFQTAGVTFNYTRNSTSGSTTSSKAFSSSYSILTDVDILDPHLLALRINAGISYGADLNGSGTHVLAGLYTIAGSGMDLSFHPFTFVSSRNTNLIADGYTPTYSLTSTYNQVAGALLNRTLPVHLYYVHTTNDTSGLPTDYSSSSDSAGVSLNYGFSESGNTNLNIDVSESQSTQGTVRSYLLSLLSGAALGKEKHYHISTALVLQDTRSNNLPQSNLSLSGQATGEFGQGLSGGISDSFSSSSTGDGDGNSQSQQNNSVSASLTHRLYNSLSTTITGYETSGSIPGGSTSTYGGGAAVSYRKLLPADCVLSAALSDGISISSQSLQNSEVAVQDERHPSVNPGDSLVPAVSGRLISVDLVETLNLTPLIVYVEGIDYRVDLDRGVIDILPSGTIAPGSSLVISYRVAVNTSITTQTNSLGGSAGLSFFGGRYSLLTTYSQSSERLVSGSADNQALSSSSSLRFDATANFDRLHTGADYAINSGNTGRSTRADIFASTNFQTENNATIGLSIGDTYLTTDPSTAGGSPSHQNLASLSASYARRFFDVVRFSTSVGCSDSRGSGAASDFVNLKMGLVGSFNQLLLSLNVQTLYRTSAGTVNQESRLLFTVIRNF
jgi:hypothetical protein